MWVSGPHLEKLTHWKDLGVNVTVDNGKIIKECEIIFLAVKPHLLDEAIRGCMLTKPFNERRLVISVLAGTSISVLKEVIDILKL